MDWLRRVYCFFVGHKEPLSDFGTSLLCPRCFKHVEKPKSRKDYGKAISELKKRHERWKKRGY